MGKSDGVWYSEFDNLMDEDDASLTDEECERIRWLIELVEDGYYDPFRIDQADVAELMKLNGIVSEEDAYMHNFTEEDEKRLADRLENDWDNLDDYGKVVYHIVKDTSNLPRWRKPYPPTQEYIHSLKEFLDINPQSNFKYRMDSNS